MIEVNGISKRFGPIVAVDDVSFNISRGEILGFLGPNGAGKTTTMRILTGYIFPDTGTAKVAGYDIFESPIEVRKHIGYLPENNPLYTDMSVWDYLEFIAQVRDIPKSERRKRIDEVIQICGLESVIYRDIEELSKGYRQRVGLAQCMIHDPDILILDEPTSGLDPNQIVGIRELIKELGREKTVIISTHILPEVSATCNRVIIINRGKIVADGSPDELSDMAKGKLSIFVSLKAQKEDVEAKLSELPWIESFIEASSTEEGALRYKITPSDGDGRTEELFKLAVQNGWIITELYREKATLEDVFRQLTTRDEVAA
ncbi:ATP-binding cassette domain-containing protein [Candidatus Poribacteria bacterium]|nr:ATP-binding cassette domain-containing protein [Candidatus Poribacteria bacterium]